MDIFLPFVRYHAKYIFAFLRISAIASCTLCLVMPCSAAYADWLFPSMRRSVKIETLAVRQRFAECVCEFCREHLGVDALPRIQQPCGLVHKATESGIDYLAHKKEKRYRWEEFANSILEL